MMTVSEIKDLVKDAEEAFIMLCPETGEHVWLQRSRFSNVTEMALEMREILSRFPAKWSKEFVSNWRRRLLFFP